MDVILGEQILLVEHVASASEPLAVSHSSFQLSGMDGIAHSAWVPDRQGETDGSIPGGHSALRYVCLLHWLLDPDWSRLIVRYS
jgi:hypothetical protein